MLVKYILYNKKSFYNIKYILYMLKNTKKKYLDTTSLSILTYINQIITILNSIQLITLFSIFQIIII